MTRIDYKVTQKVITKESPSKIKYLAMNYSEKLVSDEAEITKTEDRNYRRHRTKDESYLSDVKPDSCP